MRKIWNRPSLPVWSLVTHDKDGASNFNICTYVTAISMEPKQMMVAVYKGTKTLENIRLQQQGLLILLSEELAGVVRVCGQMSGHSIDKLARLQKRYKFAYHKNYPYFALAAGYMEIECSDFIETGGDHVLVPMRVVAAQNLHEVPLLTTDYLKEQKIIR